MSHISAAARPHGTSGADDEVKDPDMNENVVPIPVIGVIGAECTGKTSLAHRLCTVSEGVYLGEALRDWVTKHGRMPQVHDQEHIIAAQSEALTQAVTHNSRSLIVVDTAPLMTAAYSQAYFGDSSLWEVAINASSACTHLVWCQPDFPWVPEPGMRDGEDWRSTVHQVLDAHLPTLTENWPVIIATGPLERRLEQVQGALRGTL